MSITYTTNTGAAGSATIWSGQNLSSQDLTSQDLTNLEASTNGSQSAQTTNALVSGQTSGATALNGSLTPVIASAQATLDSIVANPALNLSRVLTSPSFAALVSALEGNAGSGGYGLSDSGAGNYGTGSSGSGLNAGSSGGASSSASVNLIGSAAGNSSGAATENSAAVTGNEGFFSKLLSELESVLQTPTGGNAADGLLSGTGANAASQAGTRLAVA